MAEPCNHCHQWPCVCHLTPSPGEALIDHMAQMICADYHCASDVWDELDEDRRNNFRHTATQALHMVLEAMREPSEEMVTAGRCALGDYFREHKRQLPLTIDYDNQKMRLRWRAMLSAFARTVGR